MLAETPRPPRTVVLLTTWNRPRLLRQSLPQIEREARRIGAPLVISDDQSDDPETLALLDGARNRGADLIRRAYVRNRVPAADTVIHHSIEVARRRLIEQQDGRELVQQRAGPGSTATAKAQAALSLWDAALGQAHVCTQRNNLFGFRHVLDRYQETARILKIDDDVLLEDGAFARLHETWAQAESDGHDVLAVSGIRTVNEAVIQAFPTYAITHGICNVAILFRRADWQNFLVRTPEELILRDGFDLAFIWQYAPSHRPGAVAVSLTPSVVYHTGFNGVHVRNLDLNREYGGSLDGVITQ